MIWTGRYRQATIAMQQLLIVTRVASNRGNYTCGRYDTATPAFALVLFLLVPSLLAIRPGRSFTHLSSFSSAVLDTIGSRVSGTTYGSVQQKANAYVHRNTKASVLRFATPVAYTNLYNEEEYNAVYC